MRYWGLNIFFWNQFFEKHFIRILDFLNLTSITKVGVCMHANMRIFLMRLHFKFPLEIVKVSNFFYLSPAVLSAE